jgi:purine-nucleoside phosphorylase
LQQAVYRGATWTTHAPFRETATAIEQARREGILAVEMEAAALYAFAQARRKPVVCFAHVTNQMGNIESLPNLHTTLICFLAGHRMFSLNLTFHKIL